MGQWEISFKAYCSELDEYSNEVLLNVIIVDTVSDFEFNVSKTSVVTDEDVEFTITIDNMNFFTCIVFNGADTSQSLAFGNEMICELYYSQSKFKYIQFSSSSERYVFCFIHLLILKVIFTMRNRDFIILLETP